jgi:hypothetical protein
LHETAETRPPIDPMDILGNSARHDFLCTRRLWWLLQQQ